MLIDGNTELIAHIGYPTHSFKSPLIYNPYFEAAGVNAVVVPMGCKPADYPAFFRSVFTLTNIRGALITMPHKVVTLDLLDELSPTARIAGACNAVKRVSTGAGDYKLVGDMFDGEGFVRGIARKGFGLRGKRALVVGCGGVGSAIAASLAKAGVKTLGLFDASKAVAQALAERLQTHYHALELVVGSNDPEGFDLIVNATPLGMNEADPLPVDVARISSNAMVGEVVMRTEMTAFLCAAKAKGCAVQIGTDMLFEQIPVYLEYFDLPSTSPQNLVSLARIRY